jgi:predicted Zn-dependent peptidase
MPVTCSSLVAASPRTLTGVALFALAGCGELQGVLARAPENPHALPRPEDVRARPPRTGGLHAFALANGLEVVLLEDHARPRVVVDLWFAIGRRDAAAATLLETWVAREVARPPDTPLAARLEREAGPSHASVGLDHARCLAEGPAELLEALLAREAARLAALAAPLAPDELAALCAASRAPLDGERAALDALLAAALYSPEHPYHAPAAEVDDALARASTDELTGFLRSAFGAANATLVIAGDLEPGTARAALERTFGALPRHVRPARRAAPPATSEVDTRLVVSAADEGPRLVLAWRAPPAFAPGEAELELLATILAEGAESRLERRLVLETRRALAVEVSLARGELCSRFTLELWAAPAADLPALRAELQRELEALAHNGPSAEELQRAQARAAARHTQRMAGLVARAEAVQAYWRAFGEPDGFARARAQRSAVTRATVQRAARELAAGAHVELEVRPRE